MKIQPINNIQPKTNFKANFPKQDVKQLLGEVKGHERCIIPQLYTLLDFIKNLPQKNAEIKHLGLWNQIYLDGKPLTGSNKYINAFFALYDSVVANKNSMVDNSEIKRISENEFEKRWYKNANKTKQDIENLFEV